MYAFIHYQILTRRKILLDEKLIKKQIKMPVKKFNRHYNKKIVFVISLAQQHTPRWVFQLLLYS